MAIFYNIAKLTSTLSDRFHCLVHLLHDAGNSPTNNSVFGNSQNILGKQSLYPYGVSPTDHHWEYRTIRDCWRNPLSISILSSAMHMAWVRSVCGRLKSDYRYSAGIVYNNFPWPQTETRKQRQAIEAAAQAALDARAKYPDLSLADLYDPLTMPSVVVKAHHKLDAAVDAAYEKRTFPATATAWRSCSSFISSF